MTEHTEHITLLVLPSLLARNVPLKTKPDHGGVLHRILAYVHSSNHTETAAVVHILGQALELRPKSWKWEVVRTNIAPVQLQSY